MENLLSEVLQEIWWSSLNPEFFLVSKKIQSKLPFLASFEEDVASLLFCNRELSEDAWSVVERFPWKPSKLQDPTID